MKALIAAGIVFLLLSYAFAAIAITVAAKYMTD